MSAGAEEILPRHNAGEGADVPEVAAPDACVDPKVFSHIHNVLKKGPTFMTVRHCGLPEVEVFVSLTEEKRRGHKPVEHVVHAAANLMAQVGEPTQLRLLGPIHHARFKAEEEIVLPRFKGKVVIAVRRVDVQEHLVVHHVIPPCGHHGIAPWNGGPKSGIRAVETEHVAAEITRDEHLIAVGEPVVVLGVEVVEVVSGSGGLGGFHKRAGEHVNVGSSAGDNETRNALFHRAFEGEPRADEPDATASFERFSVAFLQAQIKDTRHPAAKTRGHAAFVDFHRGNGICVEHAEKAKQMAGVVDGRVVQQQQVLVGATSTHVKPAVSLACRLDAREHLDGFQHIDLAHEGGQPLDGRHGHFRFAQVRAFGVLSGGADHLGGIDGHRLRLQFHIPLRVG